MEYEPAWSIAVGRFRRGGGIPLAAAHARDLHVAKQAGLAKRLVPREGLGRGEVGHVDDQDAAGSRRPVLGGALLAEDGTTRTGSVLIINAPDLAAAEAFSRDEPFRKAGLFSSVKISRMRRGQWNPAAAPKSADGN